MAELPVLAADLSAANPTATYEGKCFKEITFEFKPVSKTQFDVIVTTAHAKSLLCNDVIFFANTELAHYKIFNFHGTSKLTFNMPTDDE